ncbi:YnfA family protein [Pseudomonas sp. GD03842]|uniref:YnfA family protein n=1 Tax=unclassified Pseudomonas TaxID=196821 RepID=UPI000D38D2CE|nr:MULTISPECIES: YnfA family protein [unclassified Pseudomonas]MDH0749228.1 YnfA family protein [Pseudomonas sp. GD03842]RAU49251.1 YnfA family protein [Pseudomonas sp. RIT 409]RAU56008.1 YnfA family protein [Pseudomonas sp. RIT 412]
MLNYLWFFLAALFEIAGCYGFWMVVRQGKSLLWMAPALVSLTLFALLLTRIEAAYAGRAYAAYGGIYVVASIAWLGVIERARPLTTDWLGVALCVIGATVILLGPKWSGH